MQDFMLNFYVPNLTSQYITKPIAKAMAAIFSPSIRPLSGVSFDLRFNSSSDQPWVMFFLFCFLCECQSFDSYRFSRFKIHRVHCVKYFLKRHTTRLSALALAATPAFPTSIRASYHHGRTEWAFYFLWLECHGLPPMFRHISFPFAVSLDYSGSPSCSCSDNSWASR